ncbi:MAG: peptide chain release factor N(5)-glutamine methyltransferase [candidate division WOR-3 bacterium]|nr:peptide chain release factor N(5)-glutamine methyltransferase [candidate division WOR-3 bacterium]
MSGRIEPTTKAARNRSLTTKTQRHKGLGRTAGRASRADAAELLSRATGSMPCSDAEYLLMYLLGVRRHELYSGLTVPGRTTGRFRRLVARAKAGKPVQYLTGSAPFLDFDVAVDRRVLIPRPETEELVSRTVARIRSSCKLQAVSCELSAVDFGTGSGCIAIALARAFPGAKVLAVDASKAALAKAAQNVARYGLAGRIRLAQARAPDEPVMNRLRGRLDLLISNPPYVPTSRLARLDRNVRREPKLALDGGPKGANIVAMLLARGPGLLRPGGLLAIEIDSTHEAVVRKLAPAAEIERDFAGRFRYAFLRRC